MKMIRKKMLILFNNVNDFLDKEKIFCILFSTFFLALISSFSIIRYFTEKYLGINLLNSTELKVHAIVSGILSDLFVTGIISIIFITFAFAADKFIFNKYIKKVSQRIKVFLFFIVAFFFLYLLSFHIPYVSFYSSLITPFHLKYLIDPAFIDASASSALDSRVLIAFFVPVVLSLLVYVAFKIPTRLKYFKIVFIILLSLMYGAKKLNEELNRSGRVWTPVHLKVNFIENLFSVYIFSKSYAIGDLSNKEYNTLTNYLGKNEELSKIINIKNSSKENELIPSDWENLLLNSSLKAEYHFGKELKEQIQDRIKNNDPLLVWVVIIESFKPEDGKFHYPSSKHTFQPFYDSLSASGISFTNAWTVGGVTRAGQEGSLCGSWVGEFTTAMQELPNINPECLPELLKRKYPEHVFSAFWHGGRFDFDGQGVFWKKHGMDLVISKENFDSNLPKTPWGLSDKVLLRRVAQNLDSITLANQNKIQFHAVLTVTNHDPWHLPKDASVELMEKHKEHLFLPPQITSSYTDEALEEFVHFLKNKKYPHAQAGTYWDNSIIFFVNDHGHAIPSLPYPQNIAWGINAENNLIIAIKKSQANLVINGGIVEKTLQKNSHNNNRIGVKIPNLASQADIYPTILDFFDFKNIYSLSDSLFANKRRWPIMVDLGDYVFAPSPYEVGKGMVWSRKDALNFKSDSMQNSMNYNYYNTARTLFKSSQFLLFNGNIMKNEEKNTDNVALIHDLN
ncbi:LTA synthase family protein [Fluviispira sanaruensis]|uniref:Sulfatase N-terminal domain-containing protein n=1 Tax=Fluviispira sanaruensis TaxID=2493639 RepID=A0A4P2VRN2_FLUSA|nr:sulfatase-like hydrolase/transferase [Fluviispira sanaruensis]BBH51785.1 hypothetical protein JCM31447_02030 [Fluviispira sanaruensis]